MFSEQDKKQIQARGLTEEQVQNQLVRFKEGFPPIEIKAAAQVENGILKLGAKEIEEYIEAYNSSDLEVTKFVPASGAATRMFKSLFSFMSSFQGTTDSYKSEVTKDKSMHVFFDELDQFAFYEELDSQIQERLGISAQEAIDRMQHNDILDVLLNEPGLNYGQKPKGLIKFHRYAGENRTAIEEHLHEAIAYAKKSGVANLHFTVSPDHKLGFEEHIKSAIEKLGSETTFNVSFSVQKPETDTVASSMTFEPFRDKEGSLLFRPAGHGALLENLNEIDSDLIFIKNIDNVVPDSLKAETIRFKKALAGIMLEYQKQAFDLLEKHDSGKNISEEGRRLLLKMGIRSFDDSEIPALLDRPVRVCGMVKNEGEPGGGPFWVVGSGKESLQIVESAQVDTANDAQMKIFSEGTHFNPVDLVCGTKNYKGIKYDLLRYRDPETGFIAEKSSGDQKLLAMELPGLWNGSMADWNTIFVEVPLATFNPVKTVNDLLKPNHR